MYIYCEAFKIFVTLYHIIGIRITIIPFVFLMLAVSIQRTITGSKPSFLPPNLTRHKGRVFGIGQTSRSEENLAMVKPV